MIKKLIEEEHGFIINGVTFVPKTSVGYMMDEIIKYIQDGGEYSKYEPKNTPKIDKIIPSKVTIRQAKLALLDFGLLDEVDAIIQSPNVPQKTKIEWEYANEIERRWVDESGVLPYLGLEKEQVDELFLHASSL